MILRKAALTLIAAIAVISLAKPVVAQMGGPGDQGFKDVPFTHWAYDAIRQLSSLGIIEGYPDATLKGAQPVTRYEMAKVVANVLDAIRTNPEVRQLLKGAPGATGPPGVAGSAGASGATGIAGPAGAPAQTPAIAGVTNSQVRGLVNDLMSEFRPDLQRLGAKVDDVDRRVAGIESSMGSDSHGGISGAITINPAFWSGEAGGADEIDITEDGQNSISVDLAYDASMGDNWSAHVGLSYIDGTSAISLTGQSAGAMDTGAGSENVSAPDIVEAYVDGDLDVAFLPNAHARIGRQNIKLGYGFLMDTTISSVDGARVDFDLGETIDATVAIGTFDSNGFARSYAGNGLALVDSTIVGSGDDNDAFAAVRLGYDFSDSWSAGLNYLHTGVGDYRGFSIDSRISVFPGAFLHNIYIEYVKGLEGGNGSDSDGGAIYLGADLIRSEYVDIDGSYFDAIDADFSPHAASALNAAYTSDADLLFNRATWAGAITGSGVATSGVFDIKGRVKVIPGYPLDVRYATGDDVGNIMSVGHSFSVGSKIDASISWGRYNAPTTSSDDRSVIQASFSAGF